MKDEDAEIYDEGMEAAKLDWPTESSCPYPVFSHEAKVWRQGFQDGSAAKASRP